MSYIYDFAIYMRFCRGLDVFDGGTSPASLSDKTWDELDKAGKLSELRNADFETFKAMYKEKFGLDYKE